MRPLAVALFGLALCLAGATFDAASLYVPGVALIAIAGGATAWVALAASGAVDRAPHRARTRSPRRSPTRCASRCAPARCRRPAAS